MKICDELQIFSEAIIGYREQRLVHTVEGWKMEVINRFSSRPGGRAVYE
jgi:hypothetical protein